VVSYYLTSSYISSLDHTIFYRKSTSDYNNINSPQLAIAELLESNANILTEYPNDRDKHGAFKKGCKKSSSQSFG